MIQRNKDIIVMGICFCLAIVFSAIVVNAETIYAGECNSVEFPNTDPVNYSVEGNSSSMEGFTYNKTGTNITYCFHPLYKPDNFTLTFYNYQKVEVKPPVHYSFGGGGSSSTTTTTENKTKEVNETDEIIDEEIILDEEQKSYLWILIVLIVLILLIVLIIYLKWRKKEGEG